ncbi:MAG TPA: DNA alkylation repair protein [Anaerolineales bacterium]|nr:DNA alkylation repair protein [Anaerolineales bacterium]
MPSIDLARLRKQALRLAEFFFAPDEFVRYLNTTLDSYVNYTVRGRRAAAAGSNLPAHRTPPVVLRQIEHELMAIASSAEHSAASLALADRLWDEGWLETRLLAAFLLGRVPPEEAPLIARLTAWIAQIRDTELRARLVESSLLRMRRDAPDMLLQLIAEWLRPERPRFWPAAIQAGIAAARDSAFADLPGLMATLEPALRAAPADMQLELEGLLSALYAVSPTETIYLLRQVLVASQEPSTVTMFRRMSPALPRELQEDIREIVRSRPAS